MFDSEMEPSPKRMRMRWEGLVVYDFDDCIVINEVVAPESTTKDSDASCSGIADRQL